MKNVNFKSIWAIMIAFSAVFALNSCGGESDGGDTDSVVEEVKDSTETEVKKTREELIINRDTMAFQNPDSITDFEWKHTPEITFGEKDEEGRTLVGVKVGSNGIEHPAEEGHWIDFIVLNINGSEIEKKELENDGTKPEVSFSAELKTGDVVEIVAGCNLHGIWKNEKTVE